jgi:phosphohistidine swiveling domain-containing protein
MLAAGRRLATAGALEAPTDALEVTAAELGALLRGTGGPSTATVVERRALRAARSQLEPPLMLGPEVDLPLAALPSPMRKIARAQLILRDTFTVPIGEVRVDLTGDGLGDASYTGTACVAADPADALARLRPGDVLVATGTTPAYNMALSIAGAVVVEEGGLLSHAAVIARELGLPAVIGAGGCMTSIPDGAMVEVDPRAGKVRVLTVA